MVYFASTDERRQIERGLLPHARSHPVADDLRGWSWHRPPLSPIYAEALGVHEVGSKYCPTGRDVFLRRVEHLRGAASDEMGRGKLYHELLASLITRAKKLIYMHGVGCVPLLDALKLTPESEPFVVAEVDAVTRQH